jgi:hypothetical protein
MSSNKCIIPECYIDSCLIEVLLIADKNHVNHQKGNGTVAREMKNKFKNDFCIGIIDEDRIPLDYLSTFELKKKDDYLALWQHNNLNQYIIQVRPVVEKWILNICERNNIDLALFELPADLKPLQRITKSISSKNDQKFIKLFKHMKGVNCAPLLQLKGWIDFLKENKQNANLDLL